MPTSSLTALSDTLRQFHLLDAGQLAELGEKLLPRFDDPDALTGELVRLGWLTPYQADQLALGKGAGLLLGSYIVLEPLGEGGMGQVFKARHWKMGQVVALKLVRPDRPESEAVLRRFRREVQAASQMQHTHVVRALDAEEVGGPACWRWSTSMGPTWPAWSGSAARCRSGWPAIAFARRRWACSTPTSAAWSTATSSRTTCCWVATAG